MQRPWKEKSARFREFAATGHPHNSRWNWKGVGKWVKGKWVVPEKGAGPFGHVTHILSSTAKVAFLYWQRYEYTRDEAWLRDRAYPMLKGTVEFYRNFPNVKKGSDGHYHIHHVNNGEGIWDAQDTQEEVAAMRGITPILIRASEILGVDAEMRPVWREFLEHLTPLPTNDTLKARKPGEPRLWVAAVPPAARGNPAQPGVAPLVLYNLCTTETADQEITALGNATYNAARPRYLAEGTVEVHVLSQITEAAAHLGRADDVKVMIPSQLRCVAPDRDFCDWVGGGKTGVLRNRMTLREGPGAIGCQRLGRAAAGLHAALLQSVPPAPGGQCVIRVFPAWPTEWDAQFTLLAAGAFLVTSSMRGGRIEFVELSSQAGGVCRLRNPWGEAEVTLYRDNKKSEQMKGSLLKIPTGKGENVVVVLRDSRPDEFKRAIPARSS